MEMVIETVKTVLLLTVAILSALFGFIKWLKSKKAKKKAETTTDENERLTAENDALRLEREADELIQDAIRDVENAFKLSATTTAAGIPQKNGALKKRIVMADARAFIASRGGTIDNAELSAKIDEKVDFMNTAKK